MVEIRELEEHIYLVERSLGELGPSVTATVVVGAERAAVVDTLTCPADMAPVFELLRRYRRPVIVINTHADWDHVWGNASFPEAPIVGHRLCRQRLLGRAARDVLRDMRRDNPQWFDTVALIPPFITFAQTMEIDLGGLTLALHHLPGHTPDCLVTHIPQKGILLAGDCAETPLPLIEDPRHATSWARGLRRWSAAGLRLVVPCHGGVGGPDLLARNAAYLESLVAGSDEPPDNLPDFYLEGHHDNIRALREGEIH